MDSFCPLNSYIHPADSYNAAGFSFSVDQINLYLHRQKQTVLLRKVILFLVVMLMSIMPSTPVSAKSNVRGLERDVQVYLFAGQSAGFVEGCFKRSQTKSEQCL